MSFITLTETSKITKSDLFYDKNKIKMSTCTLINLKFCGEGLYYNMRGLVDRPPSQKVGNGCR